MKKLIKIDPYEALYYAIAAATFKHSAWAFGNTIEGAAPFVDWANLTFNLGGLWQVTVLANWMFWGGLMAVATDVGMIVSARHIRHYADKYGTGILKGIRNQPLHLWGAYLMAVTISSLGQVYYAASHAAPLVVNDVGIQAFAPGGWLYAILQYRILLLPLSLPGMSFLYTIAQRGEATTKLTPATDKTGQKKWRVKDIARISGLTESRIRQLAGADDDVGHKVGGVWEFTDSEAKQMIGED